MGVPTLVVVVTAVARRRRAFDPYSSAAVREMKEHSTAKPSLRRYLAEIGRKHLEGKRYLLTHNSIVSAVRAIC